MSIDTMNDGINIKDLVITEPVKKPGLPFEPDRDIAPDTWKEWVEGFDRDVREFSDTDFYTTAAFMTILFPDRKSDLNLPSYEYTIENLGGMLDTHLADVKILYPEEFTDSELGEPLQLEELKTRVANTGFALNIWGAFILYPDKWSEIQAIPGISETWRGKANLSKTGGNWYEFSVNKVAQKLLDPERTMISPDEWKGMLDFLQASEDGDYNASELAARMKILAAKEVKMTNKGLKVIMPGSENQLLDETQPVPEVRKF